MISDNTFIRTIKWSEIVLFYLTEKFAILRT